MSCSCPFCHPRIEAQCFLSYRGFMAIYNIAPALPGHSLIIPKRHVASFMDLDESELQALMVLSQRCARILKTAFGTTAFNWSIQDHPDAGQTIQHLHLHLLPRSPADLASPGDWYPLLHGETTTYTSIDSEQRPKLNEAELQTIVKKLRSLS